MGLGGLFNELMSERIDAVAGTAKLKKLASKHAFKREGDDRQCLECRCFWTHKMNEHHKPGCAVKAEGLDSA